MKKKSESCTACKLCEKGAKRINLSGDGPINADIMIVGEAPGLEEEKTGVPFVGRAGRYLDKHILRAAGLPREKVRVTNAVRCRPPDNKTPTMSYIQACRFHLEDEVKRVQPKVILLMGNVPLHSALPIKRRIDIDEKKSAPGVTGITRWRGKLIWHAEFNCYVIPTFHPSAVMRDYQEGYEHMLDQVIEDVELAIKISKKERPFFEQPTRHLANTVAKADRVLSGMLRASVVGMDLETEGFDETKDEITGVSLSDRDDRGFFIPWSLICSSPLLTSRLQQLLQSKDVIRVWHNLAFDKKFLMVAGFHLAGIHYDTMIAARLLDENFFKGLKQLTWVHLPFGDYDAELYNYRKEHKLKDFRGIPLSILYRYAADDAIMTRLLWKLFEPQLKEQHLWPLFCKILIPVREVMTEAELTGFAVNVERAEKISAACDVTAKKLLRKIFVVAGEEFNPRSPIQLQDILYRKFRLTPLKKTKTGYSCDADSLLYCAQQGGKGGKTAQYLLDLHYLLGQQSKFLNLIIKNVRADGRIHTRYDVTGTVTGRTSCSDPGIHNVPRDGLIRSLFTASKGCKLVGADLKSAELRMLAVYSNEPALIHAFEEGRDLHDETFRIMFGKSPDYQPTEDERFIAKAINFGLIYGRGYKSLAETLGVSNSTAKKYIALYFKKLPKAKQFLDDNIKLSSKRGYALSIFNRRRRLPSLYSDHFDEKSRAERQANNSVISSAAADYTYISLVRVYREIKKRRLKAKIVHTVHDCIIVDTPEAEVDEVKQIIVRCFEKPISVVTVPMKVEVEVTNSWGEGHESRLYDILRGKHRDWTSAFEENLVA